MVMCTVRIAGRCGRALGIEKGAKGKGKSGNGMGDLLTDWLLLLSVLLFFVQVLTWIIYLDLPAFPKYMRKREKEAPTSAHTPICM